MSFVSKFVNLTVWRAQIRTLLHDVNNQWFLMISSNWLDGFAMREMLIGIGFAGLFAERIID
jgi:hypothetical protein